MLSLREKWVLMIPASNWVAVKELTLSYCSKETLVFILYAHNSLTSCKLLNT